PTLPPSKLRIIQYIERASPTFQQHRQAKTEQARRAEITARRAAIEACELCDELGWLHVPAGEPTARCTHNRSTSGW
ncbi:MAG: hypothetical protein J2P19_29265, partial [Pseudonocardia sp.]|nr:hypothetical protein [Pseudonocardia sp.]